MDDKTGAGLQPAPVYISDYISCSHVEAWEHISASQEREGSLFNFQLG